MAATVHGVIERAVEHHPHRTALVDGPSGVSVDYTELGRRIERIAAGLQQLGVGRGDRVATWAPNVAPVAAVSLAAMQIGASVVPLGPALTPHEAQTTVAEAHVSVIVAAAQLVDPASSFGCRSVISLGESNDVATVSDLLDTSADLARIEVDPDDIAVICSSSGTTGVPKGVMLSHRQLIAACRQIKCTMAIDEHDVTIAAAPWFHILGLTAGMLVPLATGATVVTLTRFDATLLVDLIERHRATYIAVAPPVAAVLANDPFVLDRDLGCLELIAVGGAPLQVAVHDALRRRLPSCAIGQGWGLTESGGALCIPSRTGGTPVGTVGRPLPETEIRVVDPDNGEPVELGHDGELQARGPQMMVGYLDRPIETAAAFTEDGWLHTGDLGHVDAHGNVAIVGRLKDLIKVNGYQVAPEEVEAVLTAHPDVVDAAVVGRPHERTGETPVAYLVATGDPDVADVARWCEERLAAYKRPTAVTVVDALPRSPTGKLLRRLIAP